MPRLGLVNVEYAILKSLRKMMASQTNRNKFHIPHEYEYIWQSILAMPSLVFTTLEMVVAEPWKDWSFGIGK